LKAIQSSDQKLWPYRTGTLVSNAESYKPIGLLNVNGFYDNLLSFLDQAVEQEFLTSSARQIIISAATVEQLIDKLQSFTPVIDPSMSRINWSTTESRKKLRLDLSLRL